MTEFLIDANLPAKVKVWENSRFIHVSSLNPSYTDAEIWNYAKNNSLTIISKDKDFLTYQLVNGFPPKIIHIKFGNIKLRDFISLIDDCWPKVEALLENHSLINIYMDEIEAIK